MTESVDLCVVGFPLSEHNSSVCEITVLTSDFKYSGIQKVGLLVLNVIQPERGPAIEQRVFGGQHQR